MSRGDFLLTEVKNGNYNTVLNILKTHTDVDYFVLFKNAVLAGKTEFVKCLLERNLITLNKETDFALSCASCKGYTDMVELFLDYDYDANSCNALINASKNGHIDVVKLLIDNGADVNADGGHALICAITCKRVDIVSLLLMNGANHLTAPLPELKNRLERAHVLLNIIDKKYVDYISEFLIYGREHMREQIQMCKDALS
jgi:ankyrin repeat protein